VRLGLDPGPVEGEAHRDGKTAMNDMDMTNVDVAFGPKPENSSLSLTASGLKGEYSDYVECSAASILLHTPGGDSSLVSGSFDSVTFAHARDSAVLRYKEKKKIRRCLNSSAVLFHLCTLNSSAVLFGVQYRVLYD